MSDDKDGDVPLDEMQAELRDGIENAKRLIRQTRSLLQGSSSGEQG